MSYENIMRINKANKKTCHQIYTIEHVKNNGKTVVLSGGMDNIVVDIVRVIAEVNAHNIHITNLSRIKNNINKILGGSKNV